MSKKTNKCQWCQEKTKLPEAFFAMSPIQPKMEIKIQEAIKYLTKGRTTLVIAHRLSTILNSNKIYVIDSGKVIDEGTDSELIVNSKVYKNVYEKQIQKH